MKFPKSFDADFLWYLKVRHSFSFCGKLFFLDKYGNDVVVFNRLGVSGKESFYLWDTHGVISETKHPNLLHTLLRVKSSVNLHIKMFAEDRASGVLPLKEFEIICAEFNCPLWFFNAVQSQRIFYW